MEPDASPVVLGFDVGGASITAETLDRRFDTLVRTLVPTPYGGDIVEAERA